MRNKVNYIVGGALAFVFSIVAATGVLELSRWPHRALWIPAHLAAALDEWTKRIHIIAGLVLLVLIIYHVYRNWTFIMGMTEAIREECGKDPFAGDESPEEEEMPPGGSLDGEPIDVIDEDDDDDEDEGSPEADEDDEEDEEDGRKG